MPTSLISNVESVHLQFDNFSHVAVLKLGVVEMKAML
jgi:hypothetical protein